MGFSCYAITITNHSPLFLKPLKNLIFSNLTRQNHTQTRTRVDDEFRPDPSLVLLPLHLTTGSVNKDRLRVVEYATFGSHKEEEEESECAVCLSRIEAWHHVRELGNCEHAFHVKCIDSWMDRSGSTCPVCRAALVSGRGEEERNGKDPWRSQRMVYLFGEDCFI